jgi:hypothetical protein
MKISASAKELTISTMKNCELYSCKAVATDSVSHVHHEGREGNSMHKPVMPKHLSALHFDPEYQKWMGIFNAAWASLDLTTDLAICKFLNVTHLQGHLITSGMMFGRKARLFADLVGRSSHPNKTAILTTFNKVRGKSMRDVFAHSYVLADTKRIIFIERPGGGEARAKRYDFTLQEFIKYVNTFLEIAEDYEQSLASVLTISERNAYAKAALDLNRKSDPSSQGEID